MKFFLSKSSQSSVLDRSRVNKDFYEFNKTVLHGFPASPTCLAYDTYHKLLAIGTKNGTIQIYGKPGVEFHYEFEADIEVSQLLFLPKGKGRLVALCSDHSLHLLQISHQLEALGVKLLLSSGHFAVHGEEDASAEGSSSAAAAAAAAANSHNATVTTMTINGAGNVLFVGTKAGDVHLLDVATLKPRSSGGGGLISQTALLKCSGVPAELKKPGSVEAVEECPTGKLLLIGYNRSLIALWDYERQTLVKHFIIEQQLESLSWHADGQRFISSHNDGSYITWDVDSGSDQQHSSSSKLPYGPFPCKAITKILWSSTANGEFFIFGGGMPRASYSDKEVVSILFSQTSENLTREKNQVLDFTSKVIDFLLVPSAADSPTSAGPEALVVLVEEEIVVIDLLAEDWPQHKLPYLSCLHSSPITTSAHYSAVAGSICSRLLEAGNSSSGGGSITSPSVSSSSGAGSSKYSTNSWPITGGISKCPHHHNQQQAASAASSEGSPKDLLITGHEDGTVRFWDASSTSLKHLYTLATARLFLSADDDFAMIDGDEGGDEQLARTHEDDETDEWPPFRKVGNFDPYTDDHRLAVRKIALCPVKGVLAVGGTAGQVIVFDLAGAASERAVGGEPALTTLKLNLVDDKDGFVWKGHGALPVRAVGKPKASSSGSGYQPRTLLQITPPAAVTALAVGSQWSVVAAGTAHGFGLVEYVRQCVLICKTTLKAAGHASVAGGEALISRRKSFKKSLRESFRRLRKGRSQKGKRPGAAGAATTTTGVTTKSTGRLMGGAEEVETRPVERQIEARTEADMMSSMVRYLYFCTAVIVNNTLYPSFWVGTNAGTVFIYILASDKAAPATVWQLAKEVQLQHKAPIVFIRLVDSTGTPVPEATGVPKQQHLHHHHQPHQSHHQSSSAVVSTRVLICSEEQFKLFSLPHFKTLNKFKLTAHEGARVRRLEVATFASKANEGSMEHSLECLTNLGDVSLFSLVDFRRKYQCHFLKKEDINGITSLLLTKFGEGFYLKSSSEYQRFTLSSKRTNYPECFIQLPEPEAEPVKEQEETEVAEVMAEEAATLVESAENKAEEVKVVNGIASEEDQEDTQNKQNNTTTVLDTTITSTTSSATTHNSSGNTTFISHNHSSSFNNTVESVINHLCEAVEADKLSPSPAKNGVASAASSPTTTTTTNNNNVVTSNGSVAGGDKKEKAV
ncbi:Lethal(2) giant larvae protein 1 [Tyrophagus putrescentiae]|nr:Lethal(2) giant larvae protein 1 [Tyrophagus putrescentiae]